MLPCIQERWHPAYNLCYFAADWGYFETYSRHIFCEPSERGVDGRVDEGECGGESKVHLADDRLPGLSRWCRQAGQTLRKSKQPHHICWSLTRNNGSLVFMFCFMTSKILLKFGDQYCTHAYLMRRCIGACADRSIQGLQWFQTHVIKQCSRYSQLLVCAHTFRSDI